MQRDLGRVILTAAAATSVLAISAVSATADSQANGATAGSPGVLSGNSIQAPVHVPVNACGNTVSVIGLLNPALGNACRNAQPATPETPATPEVPVVRAPQLAETGEEMLPAAAIAVGMLAAGGFLFRKGVAKRR